MCATLYERGGSLNVIFEPTRGGSSARGATSVGRSNEFAALRSLPVSVSQARTRDGVRSCQSTWSSRSPARSRFNISRHTWPLCGSWVATTSRNGTEASRAKSGRRPSALIG